MSIASQLQALEGNIEDAYDMVAQRGGIMPVRKNMENLDDAIATIPSATTYTAGNGIDITGTTISIDDTVVAELSDLPGVMTGATSSTAGNSGLVPAPAAGDEDKVLKGDGTWAAQQSRPYSPGTTVLATLGNNGQITTSGYITVPADGFFSGKAVTFASGAKALVEMTRPSSGSIEYPLGGIPYTELNGNHQVAFCIPVRSGQQLYIDLWGRDSQIEQARIIEAIQ